MQADPTSFASILPNLSISVIAVLALVYTVRMFSIHLSEQRLRDDARHDAKDKAFRDLETEIRTTVMKQLSDNTKAMTDSAKGYERVIDHLNYDAIQNRQVKVQVNNVQPSQPAPTQTQ